MSNIVESAPPRTSSGSADRALEVLALLSAHGTPMPTATLARRCRIPRSSLHRLLRGLQARRFVAYDPDERSWSLGEEALRLGRAGPLLGEAVAVLDGFDRESPRLDVAELAQRTGLEPERVARIVAALHAEGLVTRDGDGWALGPRLTGIAARIEPVERLRRAARRPLVELRDATGETSNLLVRDGKRAIYVDQVQSRHALRHAGWAGRSIPLAGTAAGAALTDPTCEPHTASDAVEPGVTGVAARIPTDDHPAAAVSVIAPTTRLPSSARGRVCEAVQATARAIGSALGRPGADPVSWTVDDLSLPGGTGASPIRRMRPLR